MSVCLAPDGQMPQWIFMFLEYWFFVVMLWTQGASMADQEAHEFCRKSELPKESICLSCFRTVRADRAERLRMQKTLTAPTAPMV